MDEDEQAQVNSEMRYLALELMKLAVQRKQPFKLVMGEFIDNVFSLERSVRKRTLKRAKRAAKKAMLPVALRR